MKNFRVLIVILLVSVFYSSCKKDDAISLFDDDLNNHIILIEKNISTKMVSVGNYSKEIVNKDFFNSLEAIKKISDKELSKKSASALADNYYSEDLSAEEIIIFKSYFQMINANEISSILITEYYISEINKMSLNGNLKSSCIGKLEFIRDLMIYIDFDNREQELTLKKWDDCPGNRGCFDCCMYRKSEAVFTYGNWVDKAQFLVSAPASTAWWAGSCGWDCIF